MATRSGSIRERRHPAVATDGSGPGIAGIVVPLGVLALALVGLTLASRRLLGAAAAGGALGAGELLMYLAAGGCLFAAVAVVVGRSFRLASRVAGPEHRLILSLRRIRSGDLSFRIHLRKGDLLTGLADECNALLDWLNDNPPAGTRTGTDLVEVAVEDAEPVEVVP